MTTVNRMKLHVALSPVTAAVDLRNETGTANSAPPWEYSRQGKRWTCTHPSTPRQHGERSAACGRQCYCGRASSFERCEPLWSRAAPPYCPHTATPDRKACFYSTVTFLRGHLKIKNNW